jgi:hypothetical protein
MTRVAAAILLFFVVAFPLGVLFAPPVTWLAAAALVIGGTGVSLLSVPLVTAGASIALIAYTLALLIAEAPVDLVAAVILGTTLVLLLTLAHFASRVQGAAVAVPVIVSQIREWLVVAAAGVVAAVVFSAAAAAAGGALRSAALPVVVLAAALGALLTVAGVIALLTSRGSD